MFGYMTDLETVEVQKTEEVTAEGEPQVRMCSLSQNFNNKATESELVL